MKKRFLTNDALLIFMFCLVIILSACGSSNSTSPQSMASTSISSNSKVSDSNAINETVSNSKKTETEDSKNENLFSNWSIRDYVDDFGDSTGISFCYTVCEGSFENTATTGSELLTGVYYDPSKQSFIIRLLEYRDHKATYLSSDTISMKCKVGEYIFEDNPIGNAPNGDLVLLDENKKLYSYLNDSKEVRVIIYIGNSKYNFTIQGNGFKEAIAEQKIKQGISGSYKSTISAFDEIFIVRQSTPTTGTITVSSDSGSATLDYIYDPATYILTVNPDKDWTYRCVYDRFFVNGIVLTPDYGMIEGKIPDTKRVATSIKWKSPKNQAETNILLTIAGEFMVWGRNYKGEYESGGSGKYTIVDSFLFLTYSEGYTVTSYIFEGKLYPWFNGIYVIDK